MTEPGKWTRRVDALEKVVMAAMVHDAWVTKGAEPSYGEIHKPGRYKPSYCDLCRALIDLERVAAE